MRSSPQPSSPHLNRAPPQDHCQETHMQANNFHGFHPCRTVSHREKYQGVLTFVCPCCRLQCSTLVRTVTGFYNFHALWIPERYEYHVLHTFMWEASVIRYRYCWRTSWPSRLCKFLHSIEKHFSAKPYFKWRKISFGSVLVSLLCICNLYLTLTSWCYLLTGEEPWNQSFFKNIWNASDHWRGSSLKKRQTWTHIGRLPDVMFSTSNASSQSNAIHTLGYDSFLTCFVG